MLEKAWCDVASKPNNSPDLFDKRRLPAELDALIRKMNPWWEGKPGKQLPSFRRWAFDRVFKSLLGGLAPVTVVRGPRQVGKSTIQDQVIDQLLKDGVSPSRIMRVQFDDLEPLRQLKLPLMELIGWYENRILGITINESARKNELVFLLLDEVQNLRDWAPELKSIVDHSTVRVLVTGSSALRIELGRDSLAGRITTVEIGPLRLHEVAGIGLKQQLPPLTGDNGLQSLRTKETWIKLAEHGLAWKQLRDEAFSMWSQRGGYPLAYLRMNEEWSLIADQLIETVVNRAIQHDLRQGDRGRARDESLLKEVFRTACRYTGQCPGPAVFIDDIRSALNANVGWQRVQSYLRFLESALLIRLVNPLELRLKRKRGPSKICLSDHGIRAAWLQENVPLDVQGLLTRPELGEIAGHIVEGVVGQYLGGISSMDIAHFPERGTEPEVDYVLTIGTQRIPIEVKYRRRIDQHADTRGLRAFIEKSVYNAPFGVLVTMTDDTRIDDPRIVAVSLPSLLLLR